MKDLYILNGKIVTPHSIYPADVWIHDGKIAGIASHYEPENDAIVIDADGKYVLPGAIDVHTHLELPFNGTTSADDYHDGTIAAAFGGTTMVFNYINQRKGLSLSELMEKELIQAKAKACIDYAFHFGITKADDATLREMKAVMEKGVTSFKVYTTYRQDEMMIEEADMCKIMQYSKEIGALLCVHAENNSLIESNRQLFVQQGKLTPWYHYLSRDEMVEAEADRRVIYFARKLHVPLYIVHLANADGYKDAKKAKEAGVPIIIETCPQYLEFTMEVYQREDAIKFVCSPPMKNEESRRALLDGVQNGIIDIIATDHCPFTMAQKNLGKDDFTKIPNGCMGVENRYPYILSMALEQKISLEQAVQLCCYNPAEYFGCPNKGAVEVGKDADIVIFNPEGSFTATAANMHSAADYTIWEGITTKGRIETTISGGKIIVDNGIFYGTPGAGRYIERQKSCIYGKGKL